MNRNINLQRINTPNMETQTLNIQKGDDMNSWELPQPTPSDGFAAIRAALQAAQIDPNNEPPQAPIIAEIDDAPFAMLGDFSCIIGKAKSKKTFLITLFVAAFLKGSINKLKVTKHPGKKRIIWFDTEQNKYHVYKAFKRALRLSNDVREHDIVVYDLRPYSPQERQQMIHVALTEANPQKDIAFAVIDGIRDLVTDINNPEQATDCVTWLMKVTEEMELHICTVLHQNKGDNNARGHLGTEIINKAGSVLSVQRCSRNQSVSVVKAEYCRDKDFETFAFTVDPAGLPILLDDYSMNEGTESAKKRLIPSEIPDTTHREIFTEIFANQSQYSLAELIIQIKLSYHKYGIAFGDSKAKEFMSHAVNVGIISHNNQNTRNARYLLVQ